MWLSVALLNGTFYECAISGLDYSLEINPFCNNKDLEVSGEAGPSAL